MKSKPKTNRVVLVSNTCHLQEDNSENCKKNEIDQKSLYRNTSKFGKTSVQYPNELDFVYWQRSLKFIYLVYNDE